MYSVAKEMSKTDLQFLPLQEVKWKVLKINASYWTEFEFHWSGFKLKLEAGVGILISINYFIKIDPPDFNEPRVMGT